MAKIKSFLKDKDFICSHKLANLCTPWGNLEQKLDRYPWLYTIRQDDDDLTMTLEPDVACFRYCFIAFRNQIDFPEHPETGTGDPYIVLNKTDVKLLKKILGE